LPAVASEVLRSAWPVRFCYSPLAAFLLRRSRAQRPTTKSATRPRKKSAKNSAMICLLERRQDRAGNPRRLCSRSLGYPVGQTARAVNLDCRLKSSQRAMIASPSALCSPTAALGGRDIVMRLELQAQPKAVSGKADQNKPADDRQTLQHGRSTSRAALRFKSWGGRNGLSGLPLMKNAI
jgi:hypothetical protein